MSARCLFHKHTQGVVSQSLDMGANELTRHLVDGKAIQEVVLGKDVILRHVRSDRGVKRGPRADKGEGDVRVGRPPLYNGTDRAIMRGALKQHGLTGAQKYLEKERNLKVSLTTLRSVAKQFGVEFKRGRPAA